jgi:signal transduction histidine kinase
VARDEYEAEQDRGLSGDGAHAESEIQRCEGLADTDPMALRRSAREAALRPGMAVKTVLALSSAMLAAYALHALFGLGGHRLDGFYLKWVTDAIALLSAAMCMWRAAAVRGERLAWALFSLGMASWGLGNIYYSIFLVDKNPVPIPSVADALFLGTYPPVFIALVLLSHSRIEDVGLGLSLDGVIAALGVAAVSSAVVVEAVLRGSAHASAAVFATSLAYPLCDLVLLGLVVGALALSGWRFDRMWVFLSGGLGVFTVTDGIFLFKVSHGTYVVGTILDAGWLLGAVLLSFAAWAPVGEGLSVQRGRRLLGGSGFFGLVGLTILIWGYFEHVNTLALVLASAVVLAAIVRGAVLIAEKLGSTRNEMELLARQNQRLLELDALRDSFVSVVSHELRTPLTSVCGYLELLQHGEGGPVTEEQQRLMAVIDRDAGRPLRLVEDLLFVGQVDAGTLTLELGAVDLGDLAAQSAETARTHAADTDIELVLSQGRLPVLVGDSGRLGQLLDNLISNALKFTPRGGRVTVRTGRNGDVAFAEVEDTGMGISAADQERLFERFFRTTSATAQAIPGIGLGVSISQAIAEAHDGKIIVSSLLRVGTTFRFEAPLPRANTELPSPTVAKAAA